MHHENRVVIVEHENNLKMATAASTTPNEPLVVVDLPWKRPPSIPDGVFRFPGIDAVIA